MEGNLENKTALQCRCFQELDEDDPRIALGNFVFGEGFCSNYESPIFYDHRCPSDCTFYDPMKF